jgi:hypothetical protein
LERPEIFRVDSTESLSLSLEPPHFVLFRTLVSALILSTFLAVCAAFDAKMKCTATDNITWFNIENEEDLQALYESDIINLMVEECIDTFRLVILPLAGPTFVFGTLSLWIIHRHLRNIETSRCTLIPSHLSALLKLLPPLIIIGAFWTYGIYAIMLRPKLQDAWKVDAEFDNPFQSLAAVDMMGHIGANANLYYLSWTSEILSNVLIYQVCVDSFRWWHRGFTPQEKTADAVIQPTPSFHDHIHAMLSSTSASKVASFYRQRRKTWYQFLIRLRERSGYWVVACLASLLVFASSSFVFVQVLVNLASSIYGNATFKYREVCDIVEGNDELPEQYCKRTTFAMLSGAISAIFAMSAIVLHMIFRRGNSADAHPSCGDIDIAIHALPMMEPVSSNASLKAEFILSLLPTLLLGINAIFATGVQGPASEVGNLYYASFVSFFFSLRICLGCLEELRSIEAHSNELKNPPDLVVQSPMHRDATADSQSSMASAASSVFCDPFALRERRSRLRRYLFLASLSAICAASAWDAADNQDGDMSWRQKYMVFAPIGVAVVSTILFLMCLHPVSYSIASRLVFGGVVSVVLFLVWLADLVITMHSEDSWAVNEIGEIQMANLYYFTWGAIFVSGIQMMSYAKPILGHHDESDMFVLWATNIKVCMVILGASLHIWLSIADNCDAEIEEDLEDLSETFCGRTKIALGVAVTGILCGWLCTGSRVIGCPITKRYRTKIETCLSIFLIIVYGTGVALLTGMGGPGQSVGDLFYSSWLSFVVSLGIFVTSIENLQNQEIAEKEAEANNIPEEAYITLDDN